MDFALNEEQLEFKAKMRRFARDVIRPVARQARRRGVDALGGDQGRPRAGPPRDRAPAADGLRPRRDVRRDRRRGAALGLRRDRARDLGLGARRRRPRRLRHARADRPLGARVLRRRRRDQARRLRGHRGRGRLRRQEPAHDRQARRRRVGAQRDQGLHHQRRDRRRPRRRRQRRPRARPPRPGLVRGREGHARACARARRSRRSASAPRTPPRSCSRTAGSRSRTCSAGWRSSSASSSAPARASRRAAPRTRSPPSSSPGRSSAPRRSASPRPPTSGRSSYLDNGALAADPFEARARRELDRRAGRRSSARRNQQVLAQVATEIEAARLLVQRAAWMGRNGIPLTGGQGSMSKLKSGQVAVWATRTLMDLVGPVRLHRASARWRSGSATRRSTSCSRAPPRSSAW